MTERFHPQEADRKKLAFQEMGRSPDGEGRNNSQKKVAGYIHAVMKILVG